MNITLWLRQICGFLILSCILKNLLAQRRYSPYVRLFMNLLLVLLLAQPLMRIDLEQVNGIWQEVAAEAGGGTWRQQLAVLAGYDQDIGQAEEVLRAQIESLVEQKGYQLEDVRLTYDEENETIRGIEVVVCEMEDYIREPVIWKADASYTENVDSTELKQYLEEALKPAADIALRVTVR